MLDLTEAEMRVLASDLEHGLDCAYSEAATVYYCDEEGGEWLDEEATVPYVAPACTCGYFALLESAREKLQAELVRLGVR